MIRGIRPGLLRHRLTLQREQQEPDGGGGFQLIWVDISTFWGRVNPLSGSESLEAQRLEASITHTIHCRYRSDIKAGDRLSYDGRTFNIRSVFDLEERRRYLEIQAEEGVAT